MDSGKIRLTLKPVWIRFGVALLFVMGALAITSGLWLIVSRPLSSVLFLVAISLSAWFCGFRAGIFATILSGVALDFFFLPPMYEVFADRDGVVRVIVFVTEGVIVSWLLDAQRTATDELRNSREQLQALSNHLQAVREYEQKRIALEIHDELGQALTGVKMGVYWLRKQLVEKNGSLENGEVSGKLDELLNTIDSTVLSVRRIATELRPSVLDDFGLIAAIEWQIEQFERLSEIPCTFRSGIEDLDVGPEVNTAVFRIFQEALTNIARHARASTVEVRLSLENNNLFLSVTDDGIGITTGDLRNLRSLGILGMKERAKLVGGKVDVSPDASGGTRVELNVPVLSKNDVGDISKAA